MQSFVLATSVSYMHATEFEDYSLASKQGSDLSYLSFPVEKTEFV